MKRILFLMPRIHKKRNTKYFSYRLTEEAKKKNIEVQKIALEATIIMSNTQGELTLIHQNEKVPLKDSFIFTRLYGNHGYMTSLIYDIARGYDIPYNDEVNRYDNKSEKPTQMIKLSQAKIPYPPSIICTQASYQANKETILKNISFPLVLKGQGERGQAVWKISTKKELEKKLKEIHTHVILQKYLENHSDLRILVYKNNVIGAIERKSADGFYNNLSKGGTAQKVTLTLQEKNIAKKSAKILDMDFAGVDVIRTKNGPYVIEVNKSPMIKGFEETTHINVVKKIVQYITKNSG